MSAAERPGTLVVGHDASEADARIAEVAIDLARELGAAVLLVRALDTAPGDAPMTSGPAAAHAVLAERVAQRTREAQTAIEAERSRLEAHGGGKVRVEARIVDGRPFEALSHVAAGIPSAWLVVGARGGRTLLSHTVDGVLRHATVSVLVVPDGARWAGGSVIAGLDAGELDARVLRITADVAAALGRKIGVVHVRTSGDDAAMVRITSHAYEVAPDVAAAATISLLRVEGSVARTLADHARRVGAALLVVGTHGRRGLERWILGSTAESLAHAAQIPFLVVRRG